MTEIARLKRLLAARELLHRIERVSLRNLQQDLQQATQDRDELLDAEICNGAPMIAIGLGNTRRTSHRVADLLAAVDTQSAAVAREAQPARLLARLLEQRMAEEARVRERSELAELIELLAARTKDSAA
jgi:hypothetical protein